MFEGMTVFIILGAGLCAFLVTFSLIRMNQNLLEESQSQFGTEIHADLGPLKYFLPTGRIGAMWIRGITKSKRGALLKRLGKNIRQAGHPGGILPEELAGMCLANALISSLFFVFISLLLGFGKAYHMAFMLIVFIMACLPLIWIWDMRSRRQKSIRKSLPYALDLLTLGVEAGLDFTVAIEKIVRKMGKSPLAQEFAHLLRDLQMGAGRRDALANLRERIDMMDVNVFVSSLIQADELGAPLGPTLRIQSETLREKRFQRAEEQAMKAPVKIIFPLAIFILPVTGLIFLFPLAMKFSESIGGIK
jgi:tight adherence protein C